VATYTKERIVHAGAELFRRQGYTGTGIKEIAAAAAAPFGSVYHFFPGGKEQLGEEVIRASGELYMDLFVHIASTADSELDALRLFFEGAAETLEQTDYEDACPIATVALEVASTSEPLRIATADVFESWITLLDRYLRVSGVEPARSRALAFSILSLLEGAFVFSRAKRSTEPMHAAGASAVALLAAELS
jgi:AcrR family transcriptional regulator